MNLLKRLPLIDFIIPVVFLIIGLIFFFESKNIQAFGFGGVILTDVYPRVISILLIIFSIYVLLQCIIKAAKESSSASVKNDNTMNIDDNWKKAKYKLASFMGLMILYILLIRYLGYFETGFLFLAGSIFVLSEKNIKALVKAVVIAAITTIVIYFIFGFLLNIYVPSGIFISV